MFLRVIRGLKNPVRVTSCNSPLLFQQTLRFAEYQIERLRWRGDYGGVLPEGYDANSIAAQAIMEFLTSPEGSRGLPSNARSSISNDSTLQQCNDLAPFQYEINRLRGGCGDFKARRLSFETASE